MNFLQLRIFDSFLLIFFTILFIQSGLDKIFNWKGELEFTKEHFSKSFASAFSPLLFVTLTLLELASGTLSAAGIIYLWIDGGNKVAMIASCFCASTIICLFFGQRIAKDYGGAQALTGYFILALLGIAACA